MSPASKSRVSYSSSWGGSRLATENNMKPRKLPRVIECVPRSVMLRILGRQARAAIEQGDADFQAGFDCGVQSAQIELMGLSK